PDGHGATRTLIAPLPDGARSLPPGLRRAGLRRMRRRCGDRVVSASARGPGPEPLRDHDIRRREAPGVRTVTGPTDHVVVVGAGLAGLSAALHLLGPVRRVTIRA